MTGSVCFIRYVGCPEQTYQQMHDTLRALLCADDVLLGVHEFVSVIPSQKLISVIKSWRCLLKRIRLRVDSVIWWVPPLEIRRGGSSLESCLRACRALLCALDLLLGVC